MGPTNRTFLRRKTARMIVVHEDNHTCGLGSEIVATVAEHAKVPVAVRRVTEPDTFIPCNFENQVDVLPGFKRTLTVAAELLDLDLDWEEAQQKKQALNSFRPLAPDQPTSLSKSSKY